MMKNKTTHCASSAADAGHFASNGSGSRIDFLDGAAALAAIFACGIASPAAHAQQPAPAEQVEQMQQASEPESLQEPEQPQEAQMTQEPQQAQQAPNEQQAAAMQKDKNDEKKGSATCRERV